MKKAFNLMVFGIAVLLLMERYGVFSTSLRSRMILESTLPDVKLVTENRAVPPDLAYKKDYSFTADWFSDEIPIWEKALAAYRGKPGLRYLEIGVFDGRSMMWMLENILTDPTSSAVGIDPFLGDCKDRYRANLAKSGHESRVTTIVGYSQIELRKLPLDSFDIIYVDGSHKASNVLEDAVLSLRLLKKGGTLIFDDYKWTGWGKIEPPEETPRPAVDVFYAIYGKQFEVTHNGYQAILLKK